MVAAPTKYARLLHAHCYFTGAADDIIILDLVEETKRWTHTCDGPPVVVFSRIYSMGKSFQLAVHLLYGSIATSPNNILPVAQCIMNVMKKFV